MKILAPKFQTSVWQELPLLKLPAFSCATYSTDNQSNSSHAEGKEEGKAEDKAEGNSINYVSMSTMEAR